jgi:hypothetical protein
MPYTNIPALVVSGTNLFAGTYGGGVWRSSLSEMVTGVKDVAGNGVPERFELAQNYPNPFNPSKKIRFSVGTYGDTSLRVFDVLGKKIRMLVNENLKRGAYETTIDAAGLASEVYLYRLQSGDFVETKKLILFR